MSDSAGPTTPARTIPRPAPEPRAPTPGRPPAAHRDPIWPSCASNCSTPGRSTCGILNTLTTIRNQLRDYDAALAQAINDWQIAEWLEPEPRLRAALVVPYDDGDLAAAEVRRLGGDRRFVQILLPVRTSEPLGKRRYWPLYEAAVDHDLPIGIHFGGGSG